MPAHRVYGSPANGIIAAAKNKDKNTGPGGRPGSTGQTLALGGDIMRLRCTMFVLGGTLLAAGGCALHPPYGGDHSLVPPLGKITHQNNLPPAEMMMRPGPGVGGPGPGVL